MAKRSDGPPRINPKTITKATQLPDDGLVAMQSLLDSDTLKEIDEQLLNRFRGREVTGMDLPKFYDWVGIRHKHQVDALLELLPAHAIHYCWRWSYSLEKHHTPQWLSSKLMAETEVIRAGCTNLTTVFAAPFIHKAMKKNGLMPIVKHGELLPEQEAKLWIACKDFRELIAENKQPDVYSDGRLGEPPEWMLLWEDPESESYFKDAAAMVTSKIGLEMADAPDRDGQFLWLDYICQEPNGGYTVDYEIKEWRGQEPVVALEGRFTEPGPVELSLRVARRLHYKTMSLSDSQTAATVPDAATIYGGRGGRSGVKGSR